MADNQGPRVVRTASDGPVSVELSVTPESVELGKHADISLEVTAPRGVTIENEDYRRALLDGDRRFEIGVETTAKEEAVAIDADRLRWHYAYKLSPMLAGEIELPPAVVGYVDVRDQAVSADSEKTEKPTPDATGVDSALEPHVVQTESIAITVIDPDVGSLTEADLHDIKVLDPVELVRPVNYWAWGVPAGAVALLALLLILSRRRRGDAQQQAIVIPAHEWAWRQIARLVADDLMTKGRVQEFYYRVSDIVRGYIERRFGVSAPEMTTEEFLHSSARDPRFSVEHRDGVGRFLEACDLVKYARHVPNADEADELLASARSFVDRTREHSTMEERLISETAESREQAA